jgi:hypothetical protein
MPVDLQCSRARRGRLRLGKSFLLRVGRVLVATRRCPEPTGAYYDLNKYVFKLLATLGCDRTIRQLLPIILCTPCLLRATAFAMERTDLLLARLSELVASK